MCMHVPKHAALSVIAVWMKFQIIPGQTSYWVLLRTAPRGHRVDVHDSGRTHEEEERQGNTLALPRRCS